MCFSSRSKQWKESCHIFPCTGPRKTEWQARSTRASPCPQGTKREEAGRDSGKCSGLRIIHSQIYKHGRLWDQVLHTQPYCRHFPDPHLPHGNPHSPLLVGSITLECLLISPYWTNYFRDICWWFKTRGVLAQKLAKGPTMTEWGRRKKKKRKEKLRE